MTYQAANLEAYAKGYAATKDASFLADAQKIAGYMSTFLSNADGAFLVMELVRGRTLRRELDHRGHLPAAIAAIWLEQIF